MLERLLLTIALIALGAVAYRLLLAAQRRQARHTLASAPPPARPRAALLVFTSPMCAPCKLQQMPIVEHLLDDAALDVELRVVDVTEQPEVARQYGVWSLPTTIVLGPDRHVAAINQGVANERTLRAQLSG